MNREDNKCIYTYKGWMYNNYFYPNERLNDQISKNIVKELSDEEMFGILL